MKHFIFGIIASFAMAGVASAAPTWHSIVLDDFSTNDVSLGPISGFTTSSSTPDPFNNAAGSSITGRRDLGIFKGATGAPEPVDASVSLGSFTYNQNTSGGSVGFGAMVQNDWANAIGGSGGNTATNGLGLSGASIIASRGYSAFVLDLDAVSTAGFDVTLTVFGATAGDSAYATKTTAGGAELLRFDRSDFFGTQTGAFATTPIPGKPSSTTSILTWSDVYAYSINIDGTGAGGTFKLNEVYATIPEPGSMLAMAGLFGGAGMLGFRRRRAAAKAAKQ